MDTFSSFSTIYDSLLRAVESRLTSAIPNKQPQSLYDPMRYLLEGGGKRLRPVLTMLFCGAVGGKPIAALDSGAAIEILHNFTLVHDDIMDRSPLRRGRQTVHQKWNDAVAILSGDALVGYAYSLLPTNASHERSDVIFQAFTKALIDVCEGQTLDMDFNEKKAVSIDDYFNMISLKTAALFKTCAVIGGNYGYGSSKEIEHIEKYAYLLGIAFQIQDDLLDLTAEQLKLGKKIGNDIIEGKKTYLIIKAIERADGEDSLLLGKFIENNGLPESYIPRFQEMFSRLGVLNDAQSEIDRLVAEATSCIDRIQRNEYTDMLRWLVEKMNKRTF